LAHEIRTPIAELKTMLDVAQAFPNAYTPQRIQDEASQIAQEMDALVSALLLMARVEGGLDQLNPQPVAIAELCGAILAGIKDEALSQWTTQLEESLIVQSDAALVRMLLSNLIGNARSYADPRSEVYIQSGIENGASFFEIRNRAPHLRVDDLAQMTQRFWRKPGNHENGVRSGMGLSIAQALCEILKLRLSLALDANQIFSVRIEGWQVTK
jgi:two-component system, OmpR family, sensor histidine kinase QseC